jgi:micrococcal nuclease
MQKIHRVKAILTVWLPVAAMATLTLILVINRRGIHDKTPNAGKSTSLKNLSGAVSTATDFKVIDGGTIKVTFGADIPLSIRLADIDVSQLGQYYGFEAKNKLEHSLTQQKPKLTYKENDKYGRKVCTLWVDGLNLNIQLVETGFAWANPNAELSFQTAQINSKERSMGLWSRNNPTPPWEWRANK